MRLYTAELAAEEAKIAPRWVQLASINTFLGIALFSAGQYDKAVHSEKGEYNKALEYHQKALTIWLKKLGADHPEVAMSYWSIGAAWRGKKDMAKARGFIGKGRAILLKQLGNAQPPQYEGRQGPTGCAEGVIGAADGLFGGPNP